MCGGTIGGIISDVSNNTNQFTETLNNGLHDNQVPIAVAAATVYTAGAAGAFDGAAVGADGAAADGAVAAGADGAAGAGAAAGADSAVGAAGSGAAADGTGYLGASTTLQSGADYTAQGIGESAAPSSVASSSAAAQTSSPFWQNFGSAAGTAAATIGTTALIGAFNKQPAQPQPAHVQAPGQGAAGPGQFAVPPSSYSGIPGVGSKNGLSPSSLLVPAALVGGLYLFLKMKKGRV